MADMKYFSVADRIRRVAGRVPRQVGTVHRGNEPLPCRQREKLQNYAAALRYGRGTTKRKPRKRAYQTTHARRARVYEERNQRCFGEYDGHHPEPEDYTGEDGLLYCGKCRKPKEAYFAPDKAAIFGRDRHPAECDCQRTAREEREAAEKRRRHLDTVEELKRGALPTPPCGTGLSRTTTAGTRRPGLPAGMWSIGRICGQTISAACSGAA